MFIMAGQTAGLKKIERIQTHRQTRAFFRGDGVRVRASPSPAQLSSHRETIVLPCAAVAVARAAVLPIPIVG
jgi:hypothetical protein